MSRMEFTEGGEYLCPLTVVQNVGYNKKNRSVN